ncbi:MAG TPA: YkgJ family cysteine cluster protein [Candidatus Hydrogenedens sp.]|nr:YkgJ family cysteine cluster protein [Candidatus Hydrogenedens sp.]HOK09177.1 YkgJ family cysteine cluster protein [Candidatus Hydrogenedens sp.]HOL19229.1 YkgJ family cysteine cluster protein [Candidatus Hydrogenedens sp.]HPP58944.1 YkgJ family cysteine cluster protein [Candidatus Hydrogenedens sp.]
MGIKVVHFKCHHCGHCCRDVICCPTPFDVIQIVKATNLSPKEFLEFVTPEDIQGIAKSDPTWLKVNGKKYMMALKRTQKGCFFRDTKNGFCKVYHHRPLLCRLFPFKLRQKRSGEVHSFSLHKDVGCPKHRDGLVNVEELTKIWEEDQEHQQDYQELVAYFNSQHKSANTPFDFIDLFVVIIKSKRISTK